MRHQGTVKIETERLTLRRFTLEDAPAAFRNWESDRRVTEFLCWSPHKTLEEVRKSLDNWIASYQKPDFYQWAIVPKDGRDEPVGTISAVEIHEKTKEIEIGYCIGVDWWGKGIVTEAFRGIIPFFFDQVGARRICAQHDPENPASGRVMEKCGLQYEGTLRQADYNNRGIVDAAVWGLLADEYREKKK